MSDGTEAPPAKRVKLQEDTPVEAAPRPIPSLLPPYSVPSEFSFDDEQGLFGLVKVRLGHEAPAEEDTGILEYVNASIPAFSGIIKHRYAFLLRLLVWCGGTFFGISILLYLLLKLFLYQVHRLPSLRSRI